MRGKKKMSGTWDFIASIPVRKLSLIVFAHSTLNGSSKKDTGKQIPLNWPWFRLCDTLFTSCKEKKTDADWKHDVDECVKLKLIFPLVGNGCGSKNTFEETFDGRPDREQG
jgi:hypothetical protein